MKTGNVIWRKTPDNAPQLVKTLGKDMNRQGANSKWRISCYAKCSESAVYFVGPQVEKLIAVSARDGSML